MSHLEALVDDSGVRYALDGEPLAQGATLEIATILGWRRGAFIPSIPPFIRTELGEEILIEAKDQVRRAICDR